MFKIEHQFVENLWTRNWLNIESMQKTLKLKNLCVDFNINFKWFIVILNQTFAAQLRYNK